MKIGEYLQSINQSAVSCKPDHTAQEAASILREHDIGAMPVLCDLGKLVGMISERDLATRFAELGPGLAELKVEDMLTKSVIFMGPHASMEDALKTMNNHGFRHIPIVSGGEVIGVISIRDVLAQAFGNAHEHRSRTGLAVAS